MPVTAFKRVAPPVRPSGLVTAHQPNIEHRYETRPEGQPTALLVPVRRTLHQPVTLHVVITPEAHSVLRLSVGRTVCRPVPAEILDPIRGHFARHGLTSYGRLEQIRLDMLSARRSRGMRWHHAVMVVLASPWAACRRKWDCPGKAAPGCRRYLVPPVHDPRGPHRSPRPSADAS